MIYVGTCGFSYKDWLGTFYPATARPNEMLRYYASNFSAVEIDTSFYGVPSETTVSRMLADTPQDFKFCFKVPQAVTHASSRASVHSDAHDFTERLYDVAQAGKLGVALMQFPNGFHNTEENRRYLRSCVNALEDLPLVAEFRNREWQTSETIHLLAELQVGWCNADMPSYETLLHPSSDVTAVAGYVRFHGRNAAQWWTGDNTTRYEYDYTPDELESWTKRIAEIDERIEATYAFFNNHARGHAARNAETLLNLLDDHYADAGSVIARPSQQMPSQPGLFE